MSSKVFFFGLFPFSLLIFHVKDHGRFRFQVGFNVFVCFVFHLLVAEAVGEASFFPAPSPKLVVDKHKEEKDDASSSSSSSSLSSSKTEDVSADECSEEQNEVVAARPKERASARPIVVVPSSAPPKSKVSAQKNVALRTKVSQAASAAPAVSKKAQRLARKANKEKKARIVDAEGKESVYSRNICNRWRQKGWCKSRACEFEHPKEWAGTGQSGQENKKL